jgi:DNA-binding PadR family transcriptional regulator
MMFFMHKHRRHGRGHFGQGSSFAFGAGFGEGAPEGGRHGRGRRRLFDGAALKLILLRLIEQEPRHGYDLIREIEELSGGVYAPSPGVVYPTLTLLSEMGLIEEAESEGSRKQFKLTSAGSAHLAENHDAADLLFERLKRMGSDETTADRAPIGRALENLHSVLRHRVGRADTAVSTIHDIAALIDEASQKIERLA